MQKYVYTVDLLVEVHFEPQAVDSLAHRITGQSERRESVVA